MFREDIPDEVLAIAALHAWNNVPADPPTFFWPSAFPHGSRDAWCRVAGAIRATLASPSSNGRTPHFDCGNEGSNPSGELTGGAALNEHISLAIAMWSLSLPFTVTQMQRQDLHDSIVKALGHVGPPSNSTPST